MVTRQLRQLTKKTQEGFTLIELLVVIGILAILMGIVLIAINPARQFAQANNATRQNAVNQILNAVGQYAAEHTGTLPTQIPTGTSSTDALPIKSGTSGVADLCSVLTPTYIPSMPEDPSINNGVAITDCSSYDSGYSIYKDANNRVTVIAPDAQLGATISVTR